MPTKSLSQILNEFESVWSQIPADVENLDDVMEELFKFQNDIADNVDRRIGYISHGENLIEFYQKKAREYKDEADKLQRSIDGLKRNTFHLMKANPDILFKGHLGEFKIRKAGNPSCVIEHIDQIPERFKVTENVVNIDKRAIIEDMKLGNEVPGCKLVYSEKVAIGKKGLL